MISLFVQSRSLMLVNLSMISVLDIGEELFCTPVGMIIDAEIFDAADNLDLA